MTASFARAHTTHLCVCCSQCYKWQRLPLTSPYWFSKASLSLTDQPHGPSNFTTHLWGQEEALPPAKSVYVTESVERKSIPSHLDRLYTYIVTNLFLPSAVLPSLSYLHDFTQQHDITCKATHANAEKQHAFALALSYPCAHMGSWLARVSGERVSRSCSPRLLEPGHVSYRPLQKQQLNVDPSSLA